MGIFWEFFCFFLSFGVEEFLKVFLVLRGSLKGFKNSLGGVLDEWVGGWMDGSKDG